MMKTQIYSIMNADEALACVKAGADRVGILVNTPENPNRYPCEITAEEAKPVFEALKGKATSVLISVQDTEEEIFSQLEYLRPDVLHLCAGYKGSVRFREKLRERFPEIELMEAVGVTDESAVQEALRISEYADCIILDSVDPNIAGIGAAGVTHDWNIDRKIIETVNVPVIVAGGLGPENVAEVIRKTHPWGVDSLTKTSIKKDGVIIGKDTKRVKEFCRIAKEFE